MYVPAAALVTNLSVHFKWGKASVARVGDGARRGRPVRGRARRRPRLHGQGALARARTDAAGPRARRRAARRAPTSALLARSYPANPWAQTSGNFDGGLFVTAQTPRRPGFVHSSWDQGIEPWRFQLPTDGADAAPIAHTILDRPLFRAGETVHMKHLLRRRAPRGLALAAAGRAAERCSSIRHLGSDESYELPLAWDAAGVAERAWTIPAEREARQLRGHP